MYHTPGTFISDDECTPSLLMLLDKSEDEVESYFSHLPDHKDLEESELSQLLLLNDQTPAASPDIRNSPVLSDLILPAVKPQIAES